MTRADQPTGERRRESPQESAGQLAWLIAAVLVAAIPHFPHVHAWVTIMVLLVAGWRISLALRRRPLPSTWLRAPMTLAAFAGIVATYRQVSGVDAGSALLLVMVAMKTLETRGHRDRAVVVFICYFLLFAALLREQAVWSPLYVAAAVIIATTALLQITRSGHPVAPLRALATAGRLAMQAVPLMAVLFLLFPRVPGPFWSLPQRGDQGMTGLSDVMSPGDITELAMSDAVAFRVRFDGEPPTNADLYWRGPVLDQFDGRAWRQRTPGFDPRLARQIEGAETIDYEITLEPHGRRWLLALETPVAWDAPRALLNASYELTSFTPVDRRLSYRASAIADGQTPGYIPPSGRTTATLLPEGANPLSVAFAREQRAQTSSDREFLDSLLTLFRTQPFFYSLTPAMLGAQSVDDFLFNTREGFCGHYASAFAVLARAAGIPARVVSGYQGGEFNPLGDYWLVRQADAHAWVEVWLDDRWQRYDPTAAVAPERIEWGMNEALDTGRIGGAQALRARLFGDRFSLSWDAVNAVWNRWVLGFGPESQTSLLEMVGIPEPETRDLVIALSIAMGLCLAWLARSQPWRMRPDPLQRAYTTLCTRAARVTRPRRPAETAVEYAAVIAGQRPDLRAEVEQLFEHYSRLRYDGQVSRAAVDRFAAAVKSFRPRQRAVSAEPASTAPAPPRTG